ncbi:MULTISPECIES: bifunctional 5-dehydro-2-deoxygluconokinase/5-dehydro-2-deoxyphosphogluconate aldolase [Pseudomonas syringae group]|uniref:bifunctional 5-dehydro-2-deoxygluconokinase/5-dehydro-2- deoxyphosphogluconate aldolase n=1 Tax=Pseudomonas syringae group TaxID=136849 RepID=UPI000EFF9A50|nr:MULTISPECIES: 5-dehydro-2-deoxygluconokinase [Pseudomonas syringae group]MCF5713588.1 5-dehydro-2-deoxygluconokinase [Pseudomonas tremae]MCF5744712.1 5-dehydro-2-deoxygluconokinase [Pseudomonas tremae]RMP27135.1 IolC protein [Pseudomonas coronafaciens pv. atropurpurea]UQB29724.1 5-dehydro-2-deoxygluconokinase [Pseudomonas tremae]UQB38707.1 5-dehydro-2-deoxygluconokinase [Pseudomonas tremae]
MGQTRFATGRQLDLICLGRLGVDLYAQQVGARLEDVSSFAKYLGGSSANIAFGTARLGLKSAMLSRVGDDHMGRFLVESLAREGCDVSAIKCDPERLTAMVLLGLKDRETFPLVFYRENCADMALRAEDIDEQQIASSKALLITGTHFSTDQVFQASSQALDYAEKHNVRRVLDIDYRPVLWGLAGKADGETRFVADNRVSQHVQRILPRFDLIVGTEEEFLIAGASTELLAALRKVRELTAATLVVKLGPQGCTVIHGAIPARLEDGAIYPGVRVEVLNVLGAGDAFMSGFLSGWLKDASDERCCQLANACGGLVVSRHACAPAMPTLAELDYLFSRAEPVTRPDQDVVLQRLHRVSVPRRQWKQLFIFAFDHRGQLVELAQQAGRDLDSISQLKQLFVQSVAHVEADLRKRGIEADVGLLADQRFGQDSLNAATGRGWWLARPVEVQGSRPLAFEHGRSIGSNLINWPQEQIIKCLVQYHPDDEPMLRLEQEAQIKALYDASNVSGHELLLEIIPPKEHPSPHPDVMVRAMKRLYNLGIYPAWWKIEAQSAAVWQQLDELIKQRDPYCRGIVLLGLNAPVEELAAGFAQARNSRVCKGFAVGRTIFREPSRAWMAGEIDDATLVSRVQSTFNWLIESWRESRA